MDHERNRQTDRQDYYGSTVLCTIAHRAVKWKSAPIVQSVIEDIHRRYCGRPPQAEPEIVTANVSLCA